MPYHSALIKTHVLVRKQKLTVLSNIFRSTKKQSITFRKLPSLARVINCNTIYSSKQGQQVAGNALSRWLYFKASFFLRDGKSLNDHK